MPRRGRIVIPNEPVHITQRGNRQENIFGDDDDKEFYIRSFLKYKKKYKVKLYAWCLMDNHVHFVLEPTDAKGLARLFGALNTKYVRFFNKKYSLTGRLFGERYYSCLLDEEHFYEAIRYVELNPYRAKLEAEPGNYFWCSSLERLKRRSAYFLNKLPFYFSVTNWWEYLTEPISEDLEFLKTYWTSFRTNTINGKPLGNKSFIEKVLSFIKSPSFST